MCFSQPCSCWQCRSCLALVGPLPHPRLTWRRRQEPPCLHPYPQWSLPRRRISTPPLGSSWLLLQPPCLPRRSRQPRQRPQRRRQSRNRPRPRRLLSRRLPRNRPRPQPQLSRRLPRNRPRLQPQLSRRRLLRYRPRLQRRLSRRRLPRYRLRPQRRLSRRRQRRLRNRLSLRSYGQSPRPLLGLMPPCLHPYPHRFQCRAHRQDHRLRPLQLGPEPSYPTRRDGAALLDGSPSRQELMQDLVGIAHDQAVIYTYFDALVFRGSSADLGWKPRFDGRMPVSALRPLLLRSFPSLG